MHPPHASAETTIDLLVRFAPNLVNLLSTNSCRRHSPLKSMIDNDFPLLRSSPPLLK